MKNLDKFAFAGMVSCSSPSNNEVGYFSPAVIHTEIEAGQISVQSSVTVEENGCICSNNSGFLLGVANPHSGHLHPGVITVKKNAWIGYIGDRKGTVMHLGKDADGELIIHGGRALFGKGNIWGNADVLSRIEIDEGGMEAGDITLKSPRSTIRLINGLLKANQIDMEGKISIFGGMMVVRDRLHAKSVGLSGMGALVFDSSAKALESMAHTTIGFFGNGGAIIVPVHTKKNETLTPTYEAEAFFNGLLKNGKILKDGVVIENFSGFNMETQVGKKGKRYVILKPNSSSKWNYYQTLTETLRILLYGSTRENYDL